MKIVMEDNPMDMMIKTLPVEKFQLYVDFVGLSPCLM